MTKSAYIKLVSASVKQAITLDELKDYFEYYKDITAKTGEQLNWDYDNSAFPYEIKEKDDSNGKWFYLWSEKEGYYALMLAIDQESVQNEEGSVIEQTYIQVTLTEKSTIGDKGKAVEFSKFLAKKLQGELHLYNDRIMYYYPRK